MAGSNKYNTTTVTPKTYNTSTYGTQALAKSALEQLSSSLKGVKANSLGSYVTDGLRADYAPYTDEKAILGRYNAASDAAWDLARAEQIQAMNAAERSNYASTKQGIASMRSALAGSAASGASQGAANATALQALLGLGQQNAEVTTAGMQGYQNAAKEAAAARAQNAISALEAAKGGIDSMYGQATSAYNSDHLYGMQGLADSYGNIATAIDNNASAERMNDSTNATNQDIANTHTKQTIYNKK